MADEDRRRRGRGPQRRDQHVGVPRRRRLAQLADPPRRRVRASATGRRSARALDWVVSMQLPCGGIAWSQEWADGRPAKVNEEALLAGSSSIYQSLRAGVALSPSWSTSRSRSGSWPVAGSATRCASTATCSSTSPTFSMDWYYPVLGGAVRGDAGRTPARRAGGTSSSSRTSGIRCVDSNPWVTGAETCELVMALDAHRRPRPGAAAVRRHAAPARRRRLATGPATSSPTTSTGPSSTRRTPRPRSSWPPTRCGTARRGADIMRGTSLPADFAELGLECGCRRSTATGRRRRRRVRRSTRIDPSASTSVERAALERAAGRCRTAAGRRRPGRGRRRG